MLKVRLPPRAHISRLLFEGSLSLLCAGLVILSICHPGHISRQVDLMTAGALVILYLLSRPRAPVGILVAIIVFIPAYALPPIGVFPGSPPALVCLLVAIVLVLTPRRTRSRAVMTPLDWTLALLMVLMFISVLTGVRELLSWVQNGIEWVAPFACGRMLGVTSELRERLARAISVAGAGLAGCVLVEAVTSWNPFSRYLNHDPTYGFLSGQLRSGVSRTVGSFGDPIALSMFFATAIILCLGLVLGASTVRQRRGWSAVCALMLMAQLTTLSRTAWLMLGVALVYAAVALPDRRARRRLQILCACGFVTVILLGQFGPTSISSGIPVFGTSNSETAASANYRSGLVRAALHDTGFRAFGTVQSTLDNKVLAGYGSIDNEYLNLLDSFGYVPAAALAVMFGLLVLLAALVRPRRDLDVLYVAAALSSFVALSTVALITQQQVVFWLIVGVVSGVFASRTVLDADGRLLCDP